MKIKYNKADGKILAVGNNPISDDLHTMDYDPETESIICLQLTEDCLFNSYKYKIEDGEAVLIPTYSLALTCSATDTDSDGTIDIPADGSSSCTITIRKKTSNGNNTTGSDEVWISCSRGRLDMIHGNLSSGQLQVTLTSIEETVLSDIKVTANNPYITDGSLKVQFRP